MRNPKLTVSDLAAFNQIFKLEKGHLELMVTVHQQQIMSRPIVCITKALT